MPLPKIRVGIKLSFKSNSVSSFDLDLSHIERYHGKNIIVDSSPRLRLYHASRCSSPNIRRLTPRVPDVTQGANWWRNVYTRRFAATYTCTRACAHTRLLASSSYESTSVHGRWPSSRSWNQTRHRSRGRGVVSTQCVFHPKIAFCSPSVSYPEVFFLFRFSLRSSQCSRITLCSSSDT